MLFKKINSIELTYLVGQVSQGYRNINITGFFSYGEYSENDISKTAVAAALCNLHRSKSRSVMWPEIRCIFVAMCILKVEFVQ